MANNKGLSQKLTNQPPAEVDYSSLTLLGRFMLRKIYVDLVACWSVWSVWHDLARVINGQIY